MKKTILSVFAVLLLAVPALQAQKVNKSAILAKIEKSDAEIADAKKAAKAATWLNRGKAFYEAVSVPTKDLYTGWDTAAVTLTVGAPQSQGTETIGNTTYEAWVYPYFTAYFLDGKLAAWKETKKVVKDGIAKAFEAYGKAYELDPKTAPKVKAGLEQLVNYCKQLGDVSYTTRNFVDAGAAFAQAYDIELHPACDNSEPLLLYHAGVSMTIDGSEHPESFKKGMEYLTRALAADYNDEEGQGRIYYYLFHCYYGQREESPDMLLKAKDALLEGIAKYPKNDLILQGLMQLYTAEENVGDPADLVALIDNAIAADPTNIDLWFGRGRIFYALKDFDESIASFQKVTELNPELFEGHYYLGLFYIFKGDDANQQFNDQQFNNQAAYDAGLKEVNAIYMEAVPVLERALELKPNDFDTVNSLKQLCFRLRDEEGIMAKYEKYNALYKELKGE